MLNKTVPALEWTTMIIIGTHQRHLSIFPRDRPPTLKKRSHTSVTCHLLFLIR